MERNKILKIVKGVPTSTDQAWAVILRSEKIKVYLGIVEEQPKFGKFQGAKKRNEPDFLGCWYGPSFWAAKWMGQNQTVRQRYWRID